MEVRNQTLNDIRVQQYELKLRLVEARDEACQYRQLRTENEPVLKKRLDAEVQNSLALER